MSSFGDELRRLRRRSGLSQESLADQAGLSTEAISLLERGRRTPRMTTMRLLADAMRLDDHDRSSLFATSTETPPVGWTVPTPTEPLIGRESDLADLGRLLRDPNARLITVCGAGGVGKTRLSIAAAGQQEDHFADGVRWLPVASLADRQALYAAVASALGAAQTRRPQLDSIVDHLLNSQQLLIIDNAESLIDPIAELCSAVLAGTSEVTILLTSRHQLQVPGETVYALHPLAVPPVGAAPASLATYPASRLLLERMGRLDRRLADASDTADIVRICRRLDGLPLALELAAARTGVLTVSELADTLDRTLAILSRTRDTSLTEEVVGWSYRLLTPVEQAMFARLGVFTASFSRDDAAEVCAAELSQVEVLDALASLVSKSLVVRAEDVGSAARFRQLQVVRQFAREQLDASDEAEALRERHARHVLALVQRASAELVGGDQQRWLDVLEREVTDIRAAIGWLVEHAPMDAQRLVGASWRWCYLRGRYAEGRAWAEAALAAAPGSPAAPRASALSGAGMLAFLQCDYAVAQERIQAARQLYAELGDELGVAWCLARLGSIARERGRYDEARELHRQSLALADRVGNVHQVGAQLNYLAFVAWLRGDLDDADALSQRALDTMTSIGDREGTAWALTNAGISARYRGDLDGAALLLRQSLELSESIAFREGIAWARNQLGVLARLHRDQTSARTLQTESLEIHRDLGDRWRMASVMDELAAIAAAEDDVAEAVARLAAADRLRNEIGAPVPDAERADRDRTEAVCRAALGDSFQAAALVGLSTPIEPG
jgi:predicted ATPase/DNA-binding XRE family transcriptional regulator/Tfp pilus assembly protein PilF